MPSQAERRIEVYRRTDAGQWLFSEARGGETIEIAPLAVTLDLKAIYANPLEAQTPADRRAYFFFAVKVPDAIPPARSSVPLSDVALSIVPL